MDYSLYIDRINTLKAIRSLLRLFAKGFGLGLQDESELKNELIRAIFSKRSGDVDFDKDAIAV